MTTFITDHVVRGLLLVVVAVVTMAGDLGAQRSRSTRWRFTPMVSSTAEFDDNVFLLEPARRDNLADASVEGASGGRYADMTQPTDVVTTLRTRLDIEGRGLFGRDLSVTPEVAYDFYAQNAERSNATYGVTVDQELAGGRRLQLRARTTPGYFSRNYLADATDLDDDGSIAPGERRYAPGRYSDLELSLAYRVRLDKSTKKSPFGANVQFELGHYARTFEAPFRARDLSGPTGSAVLALALTRRLSVAIDYDVEALAGSPTPVVMLLDETSFGRDFNGNGTTTDIAARAVERMDGSRLEQRIGLRIEREKLLGMDAELGIARRWRRYGSEEPYDIANNGRRDARTELSLEATRRLTRELRLEGGVRIARQNIERANDPGATGDEVDYERRRVRFGLSYRF